MEVINNVILVILEIFDAYIIYKFMCIFLGKISIDWKVVFGLYLSECIVLNVITYFNTYPIINLLCNFIGYACFTCCHKASIRRKTIAVVVIMAISVLCEAVVAWIIGVVNLDAWGKTMDADIFTQMTIEIIFWTMTLITERFRNIKSDVKIPIVISLAVVSVSGITLFMLIYFFQQGNVSGSMLGVSLLCVLLINILIVYLYDSLSNVFSQTVKMEIIKREKIYYHHQSEMLKNNYDELRNYRHDIKNRLCAMEQMLINGNIEELKGYLSANIEKIENTKMFSKTGNIALDSVINYKFSIAESNGITVRADIALPQEIEIEDDDLIVVLGNLLDNAMEAAEKSEDRKEIDLNIEYKKGCMVVKIRNTYNGIVNEKDGKLSTIKNDKKMHGIGLRSVDSIVEKYRGCKMVNFDGTIFEVKVMLYT